MASETEVVHVRIDKAVLARVDRIAADEDRHRAYIIQRLLTEALDAKAAPKGGKK